MIVSIEIHGSVESEINHLLLKISELGEKLGFEFESEDLNDTVYLTKKLNDNQLFFPILEIGE